jgi:hypothetical protein
MKKMVRTRREKVGKHSEKIGQNGSKKLKHFGEVLKVGKFAGKCGKRELGRCFFGNVEKRKFG